MAGCLAQLGVAVGLPVMGRQRPGKQPSSTSCRRTSSPFSRTSLRTLTLADQDFGGAVKSDGPLHDRVAARAPEWAKGSQGSQHLRKILLIIRLNAVNLGVNL